MARKRIYVVYSWSRGDGGHWLRGARYSRAREAQATVNRHERLGRAATYEVEYRDERADDLAD
jgi:hypothetical protein